MRKPSETSISWEVNKTPGPDSSEVSACTKDWRMKRWDIHVQCIILGCILHQRRHFVSNWGILNMECVSILIYLGVMMVLWLCRRMSVLKRTCTLKYLVWKYHHVYNWLSNSSLKCTFVCVYVWISLLSFRLLFILFFHPSIHPSFHLSDKASMTKCQQTVNPTEE